jgi:hypothetical protein
MRIEPALKYPRCSIGQSENDNRSEQDGKGYLRVSDMEAEEQLPIPLVDVRPCVSPLQQDHLSLWESQQVVGSWGPRDRMARTIGSLSCIGGARSDRSHCTIPLARKTRTRGNRRAPPCADTAVMRRLRGERCASTRSRSTETRRRMFNVVIEAQPAPAPATAYAEGGPAERSRRCLAESSRSVPPVSGVPPLSLYRACPEWLFAGASTPA